MNAFFRKLRWLTQRPRKEAELRDELEFHLEEEMSQRREAGLAEEEARWAARRDLGNNTLVEENTRAVWGWTLLEHGPSPHAASVLLDQSAVAQFAACRPTRFFFR